MISRPLFAAAFFGAVVCACYSGGGSGNGPPPDQLYYPVGLVVSKGGNVLYAVNSDFDLQWNGGTLQSYDLFRLRHDADALILANLFASPDPSQPLLTACPPGVGSTGASRCIPFLNANEWHPYGTPGSCLAIGTASDNNNGPNGGRTPLGQACSPAVDSAFYIGDAGSGRSNVVIGALATDLQLSPDGTRLFAPVRGDNSVTWADVQRDDPNTVPPADIGIASSCAVAWSNHDVSGAVCATPAQARAANPSANPFDLACASTAGNVVDAYDTRQVTMPGEPFAMALTPDGTALAVTNQTSTNASLLLSGCGPMDFSPGAPDQQTPCHSGPAPTPASVPLMCAAAPVSSSPSPSGDGGVAADAGAPASGTPPIPVTVSAAPSMQFVLNPVPNGGDGIAAVPHDDDPRAVAMGCEYVSRLDPSQRAAGVSCVRPAFLETNHASAEIDLLRYYDDFGSSLPRPYLVKEVAYSLTSNEVGTDQRGIAIDPSPRIACHARATTDAEHAACSTVPARVFIASRSPASLVVGQIGGPQLSGGGSFDPDLLTVTGNVPLSNGPSKVYLAPVVDEAGRYSLRVFVICFDSNQIFVYDPDEGVVENVIDVGLGPFAMAFDPFDPVAVATHALVPDDVRQPNGAAASPVTSMPTLKRYRFAYVASFTNSFVQMIDLDDSLPTISPQTFERVVFTLGQPTAPKGQ